MKLKYPNPIKVDTDMTIFSNSDNVTCIDLGYKCLTETTIDLVAFNKVQRDRKEEEARDLDHYWDLEAEKVGGKTSPRWLREMERLPGASKIHLSAFPKFNEKKHCLNYPGIVQGCEVHVALHFGIHYTAVITYTDNLHGFTRLHFVEAYKDFNKTINEFIMNVKQQIETFFVKTGRVNWYVTPQSILRKKDITESPDSQAILQCLSNHKIYPRYYEFSERDALDAINARLMITGKFGLEYITCNNKSELLKRCFNGGYARAINNSRGVSVPTDSFHDDKFNSYTAHCICTISNYLFVLPQTKGFSCYRY